MKKWLMAVLFGTVLVLGACGGGDDTNDTEEPADTGESVETDEGTDGGTDEGADEGTEDSAEDGGTVDTAAAEEAYQQSCASCHGADLTGGAGPDLTAIGSKLSADEIADIIENGQGSMPGGLLSGEDATAVAEWLAEQQ